MPIVLTDFTVRPNGAKFHAGDLHIHTFGGSKDVTDTAMTVELVIDQAVAAGISLLAITDHNSDRNTQKSIEYAQKYAGTLPVLA